MCFSNKAFPSNLYKKQPPKKLVEIFTFFHSLVFKHYVL